MLLLVLLLVLLLMLLLPQGCHGGFGASVPMLVNSTNDGLSWSSPYFPTLLAGPGKPPLPRPPPHLAVGPTKGLTVKLPNGGVRLMIPGEADWSASVYSDDHGRMWMSNVANRSLTLSPGEM